jgi:hypothetical protein
MRIAGCLVLCLAASGASAQDANPVLGSWAWNPTRGTCPETHTYTAEGTATSRSGDEVLEKRYTVTPAGGGMYRVESEVLASNGGRDCLGSTTAVGATSAIYVLPINGGGYYTCASEDGMSCFGSARPAAPAG